LKIIRFALIFAVTLTITIAFNSRITIGDSPVPPLGKFFNPFGGFWQNSEKEAISGPSLLEMNGLKEEVTIQFDEYLIPHIFAQNDEDLYFVQGYVTAFHRLWQMDFLRYIAAGQVSEILGETAVNFDKDKRRKGLSYGARKKLEAVEQDPIFRARLQAYTDGVNTYINSISFKDYPIEYKLLNYSPELWTNLKSFLVVMMMAEDLSLGESDLENTNALKRFGREVFDLLYPEKPLLNDFDPVIPLGTKFTFESVKIPPPNKQEALAFITRETSRPNPDNGSNNFAVGALKTGNGALLANEPDLALNLPSIWYIAHLNAPGVNVFGATIPGVPGVIIGHNDSIAWGLTNAKRDLVDWYKIEFRNSKRDEYRYDNQWLKTDKIVEEIKIRDGSSVFDTIVFTHYGPVVYDQNFTGSGDQLNLAMRWVAHDPTEELKTGYYINRANNYEEFKQGLAYWESFPQNFAFANVKGDVGLHIPGKFPVKWKEQGKFILDGTRSVNDWKAYIPEEHELDVMNPPRGFVSSANQHPVDSTYPYYTYDYNFEHYRGRRLNDRLNILNAVTVEDMMKLQNDNFNYRAFESLPMMLDGLNTTSFNNQKTELHSLLKNWDYFNNPDLQSPSIYELWWIKLYHLLWDEFENSDVSLMRPDVYNSIRLLKNTDHEFVDIKATSEIETARDLFLMSFNQAVDSLNIWIEQTGKEDFKWSDFKNTRITHLLRIPQFSQDHVPVGGNRNIVNAASGTHGPSWRMVVQLNGDGVKAWGVYPGSQTGNPGNVKYGAMIEDWAKGNYHPMLFSSHPLANNNQIILIQTFKPQ